MESVDNNAVREHNQRAILEYIYRIGTTSRAALAKELKMSKPAIADNLEHLIDIGIVKEVGEGESTERGGRRPRLLQFHSNQKYIIVIDLNFSNPLFVLSNLSNEIFCEFNVTVHANAPADSYLSIIENGIRILMDSYNLSAEDLVCVSVASPGMFDFDGNLCSCNPSYNGFPWASIDIRTYLQSSFNIPVIIKNDIKAATLGEWEKCGNMTNDMLYISCGLGLGAGIILNGELLEGNYFTAGELFAYTDAGRLTHGQTIENLICLNHLLFSLEQGVQNGVTTSLKYTDGLTLDDVIVAYKQGDPYVCDSIRSIGRELGIIALNCSTFLSIRSIVFGGEYAVFSELILEEMYKIFAARVNYTPQISISKLGRYAGIYGMLSIARAYYFDFICKKQPTV